jgi:aspartate carbamoyltransferase catalytic subunit
MVTVVRTEVERTQMRESKPFLQRYTPHPIQGNFKNKHIVTVEQLEKPDMEALFATAADFRSRVERGDRSLVQLGAGKVMATLFYEASTRTDMSFQAAMRRLGGEVIGASNGVQFSSVYKGEDLADTVRAAACYADVIVLRHPEVGSSYQAAYYLDLLRGQFVRQPVVISGGDGVGEHPTQALLDLYTIIDLKHSLDGLTVTMVGDLRNGRTVHSLAKLIARFETSGTRLCLVSPNLLRMPQSIIDYLHAHRIELMETSNLHDVLDQSDVIYWTRVQEERFEDRAEYEAIRDDFIMTPDVLSNAKADTILMHPLPRKNEMGDALDRDGLDNDPRAAYFRQMENGMYVRMALLAKVLGVDA